MRQASPFSTFFQLLLTIAALSMLVPSWASDMRPAGEVIFSMGAAWKDSGKGKISLNRGDTVAEGDILQTAGGQLIVKMSDGGLLSLRENSKTSIDQYKNNHGEASSAVRITVEQGIVRSATGEIGEKDKSKFRVNTPFSALGIRGTDFITSVSSTGQIVFVVSGEISLSPFDSATGCNAAALGECRGASVKTLAARNDAVLSLARNRKLIELNTKVPDFIRPIAAEDRFFLAADTSGHSLVGSLYSAGLAGDKIYDKDGNSIQPYSRSVRRAVFEGVVEGFLPSEVVRNREESLFDSLAQTETERLASASLFLFDLNSSDTDRDGIDDFIELGQGLNPWRADTDFDGLADKLDANPRVEKVTYFNDSTASPVTLQIMRQDLQVVNNTIDRFALNNFGKIGFFTASSATRNSTYSMWVDPAHQRLWGQKRVLETLLSIRELPESVTVWGTLPSLAADLSPNALDWLNSVGKNNGELYSLSLVTQTIVYSPTMAVPTVAQLEVGRSFEVEFTQTLNLPSMAASTAVESFNLPRFKTLTAKGSAFQFDLNVRGQDFTLTGAASDDGILVARDGNFQMRGVLSGNTLIVMLSDEKSGRQFMLGLVEQSDGSKTIDNVPVEIQTLNATGGVTWGRWQNFASLKPEDMAKLVGENQLANSHFILNKPKAVELPKAGRFEFFLQDHEAVYSNGMTVRPAEVTNPFLQVDFDRQRFTSTFDVKAPGVESTNIRGAGTVGKDGLLLGSVNLSNANLQGVLADQGKVASLLFEKQITSGGLYSGITHWGR